MLCGFCSLERRGGAEGGGLIRGREGETKGRKRGGGGGRRKRGEGGRR